MSSHSIIVNGHFKNLSWSYYIYLRPRGNGRKLAWQGAEHENTKSTVQLRSFFVNVDESEAGTCWSEGMRMRTYDSYLRLHEGDEEIQHSQHDDQ